MTTDNDPGTAKFSLNEALLLADSLNGVLYIEQTKHLLWATIEDAIRTDELDRKWGVDGAALVERLRNLSPVEQGMIAFKVQQVWGNEAYHTDSLIERVKAVGLVENSERSEGAMSYHHTLDAPFRVGDAVMIIEGPHTGKRGKVTRREPDDAFYAGDAVYFVTFEGDTQECTDALTYWQLAFL